MENKDSRFKWKTKNSSLIFGLCLVGVAAFSTLFAMNQVEQAEREKNQIQNEAGLENMARIDDEASLVPSVDEAIQNALEQVQGGAAAKQDPEDILEGSEEVNSSDITAEIEDVPSDLTEDDAAQEDAAQDEAAVAAQSTDILPTVAFDDTGSLNWPVAGSVVLDYSMDGSIFFPTLQQYKYNPALIIGTDVGAQVVSAAKGIVERIENDAETGTTVTMNLGNGYKLKYGQMKDLNVSEGDVVERGDLLGCVSEPTKYYCVEGSNLYFSMTKDELPVDPVLYLE